MATYVHTHKYACIYNDISIPYFPFVAPNVDYECEQLTRNPVPALSQLHACCSSNKGRRIRQSVNMHELINPWLSRRTLACL